MVGTCMLANSESYRGALADPSAIAQLKDEPWGFGSTHPWFEFLIERVKPNTIVEVGTWLGGSAIHMAGLCKHRGLATTIYCCDTWLGSSEHWLSQKWSASFEFRLGYPTLYQSFLKNVARAGAGDVIHPVPLDSISAAEVLAARKVTADLVYIDAGHSYDSCLIDLRLYSELLADKGVILGDDFEWPGVATAVAQFVADKPDLTLYTRENKFILTREPIEEFEAFRTKIDPSAPLSIERMDTALAPLLTARKRLIDVSVAKFLSLKLRGKWERFVKGLFAGVR